MCTSKKTIGDMGGKILNSCVAKGMTEDDILDLANLIAKGGAKMSIAGRKAAATRKANAQHSKRSAAAKRAWVTIRKRKAAGHYK